MAKQYSVTNAGTNPVADRQHRQRVYYLAMFLRFSCVLSLFWVRGWWMIIAIAGAVILPWLAVMIANAVAHTNDTAGTVEPKPEIASPAQQARVAPAEQTIVVDVPAKARPHPAKPETAALNESSDDPAAGTGSNTAGPPFTAARPGSQNTGEPK